MSRAATGRITSVGIRLAGPRVDTVVAVALTLAAEIEVAAADADRGARALSAVTALALLSLAARRRHPAAVIAVILASVLVQPLFGGVLESGAVTPIIGLVLAAYSLGAHAGRLELIAGLAVALAGVAAIHFQDPAGYSLVSAVAFFGGFVIGAPTLVGRAVRSRERLLSELRDSSAQLREAGSDEAAVAGERARLDRELHELVRSGVGEIVTSADAAVRGDDPEAALGRIESLGRQTLVNMRELVGALRLERPGAISGPQPGLEDVPALVERARDHGANIALTVLGSPKALGPGAELAGYRFIQAALSSAERGQVTIEHGAEKVAIEVLVPGAPPWSGAERATLRERLALYGGGLRIGSDGDIRATLPSDPVVAANGQPRASRNVTAAEPPRVPARRRGASPSPLEVAGAAAFALVLSIELQLSEPLHGPRILNLLGTLAVAAPLAWSSRRPLASAATSLAAAALQSAVLTPLAGLVSTTVLWVYPPFAVARYADRRRAQAGLAICAAGMAAIVVAHPAVTNSADVGGASALLLGGWSAGRLVRARAKLLAEAHENALRLADEQDAAERAAVALERARIARELHDVTAHSMTVLVLQASAARRVWARDPARAHEHVETLSRVARDIRAELARAVGILRIEGDGAPGPLPPPSLTEVEALAERARAAGVDVAVEVAGETAPLDPSVDLAAYRVVQEALTNVMKHSRASAADIVIRYGAGELEVAVVDDGGGARPPRRARSAVDTRGGHGLRGMAERVAACGGEFAAGRNGHGFSVRARLPAGQT